MTNEEQLQDEFDKWLKDDSTTKYADDDWFVTFEQVWKLATAAADAKYLPVIEKLARALDFAQPCVKPMRVTYLDGIIAEALALAEPLLKKDKP